jgi:vancomycin resistance protein YoaR
MKKVLSCIVCGVLMITGYVTMVAAAHTEQHYFSIHYDGKVLKVTDSTLAPEWYNVWSMRDFAKGKNIYQRAAEIKRSKDSERDIQKNLPEIWQLVQKLRTEIEIPAYDGDIVFDSDCTQKFRVENARDGVDLDERKLCTDILDALVNKKTAKISAVTRQISHKTEEQVISKLGLRAKYSTRFDASNSPRTNNIRRSLDCFDGLRIAPGNRVSFNEVVGPRTKERGYQEAKIILDGEFTLGTGGGVCQSSTTIFNAVLLAGLDVVSSSCHSLPISYVPLGRDAMVSSGADLVFANNTGGYIYIKTEVRGNTANVEVYGNKLGNVEYRIKAEVEELPMVEKYDGRQPADLYANAHLYERKVIDRGEPERKAVTYIEAYNGNRLVHRKRVRKSRYKGEPQVYRYERLPDVIQQLPYSDYYGYSEIDRAPEGIIY